MWGSLPPFPWEEFSSNLTKALGSPELSLSAKSAEWRSGRAITEGIGENFLHLAFELSPIKGSVHFLMPKEDFEKISKQLLRLKSGPSFVDPFLEQGFFQYTALNALSVFSREEPFQGLTPRIVDLPLAHEDAYCIDIKIGAQKETSWARLICPTLFHEGAKEFFTEEWASNLPTSVHSDMNIDLCLSAGSTTLSQKEWKGLKQGDFLLLETCSYFPKSKKGTFLMGYNQTPLFQTKLKQDSIKILDYALYHQENTMTDEAPPESFENPIEAEQNPIEEAPTVPTEKLISPKNIPLTLSVEVGKLQMSLDKLLKLKPGNVLDLAVQPEMGVDLVSKGKPVARGQLVQVGDVVGVKITEIG